MADWITTHKAAELSGYNAEYIRVLIRKGKIKSQKWGRDWQISRASLLAYMRAADTSSDQRHGAKNKRS